MIELDLRYAMMLFLIDGIGPMKYLKLIEHFRTYDQFLANPAADGFYECGLNDRQIAQIIKFDRWQEVDGILEKAASLNITIKCLGQPDYPEELKNIYSPPIVIFIKGNPQALSLPAVAIVGSRTPTDYGREMTRKIASGLAARGLLIISGLALGIDAEAHRAALDVGGTTAAIFGSGLDIIYPPSNRDLADKILENGFWLSEFQFGTLPEKYNFPRRNRLISGLSRAVVVIEAASKSGALVTAQLAADQGKDVFAVPGRADSSRSEGTLDLLKQGAAVATSASDILEALGWEAAAESRMAATTPPPIKINLEPDEQKVCDMVGKKQTHFDELVRDLGLPCSKISAILLKLELAGLVKRRPGNYVARL